MNDALQSDVEPICHPVIFSCQPLDLDFNMQASNSFNHLSSLTVWSMQHIRDIFESGSDDQCIKAVAETFSENIVATINGNPITREDIKQLVLGMRKGSQGLRVHWQQAAEVPKDPATNRVE